MGYKVAVVGATGNVGREMLNILDERKFPADEVVALASRRSIGGRPEELDQPGEVGVDGEGGMSATGGALRSRADALRRLAEVAQYFQRTEPHSPVAYLVQRAIKWGQMPLEVWLEDVIKDGAVLGHLKETLGLDTPLVDDSNG